LLGWTFKDETFDLKKARHWAAFREPGMQKNPKPQRRRGLRGQCSGKGFFLKTLPKSFASLGWLCDSVVKNVSEE
jgi:hypothetical protein